MNTSDPFELLLDLEQRTKKISAGLPALDRVEDEWVGVGFRVGDSRLIASMSDVKEILDLPEVTKVPGVKSWVVGIANVRGSLLPIMDMKSFLLGEDIRQRHKGRVIVIDYMGVNTGLVVEEVFGMRHFNDTDVSDQQANVPSDISPFIEKVYQQELEHWPVFSFDALAQNDRFAHASV